MRGMDAKSREAVKRLQIALWLDCGLCCLGCCIPYRNVDDFLRRKPMFAYENQEGFFFGVVDEACWRAYETDAVIRSTL